MCDGPIDDDDYRLSTIDDGALLCRVVSARREDVDEDDDDDDDDDDARGGVDVARDRAWRAASAKARWWCGA